MQAPGVEHANIDPPFWQQRAKAQNIARISGPTGDEQQGSWFIGSFGREESTAHARILTEELD
jgi:hypothetical protein